ncbi:acyltransferase family protein [Roseibacillus ishigakijimensis]|uniref:DUF1624 domain-containing protein n=1 Tax=Roseibacillus ishigakijimensis TaxID=454146 RepID=A0A934RTM0_9BACT|nr:heparan-alpha-glucosaminide N-acetyltransferase domain-containing protein [Roseibacillus ishigakijimensis]MBK1835213.1 DUF1624 domain-containing protein [Roseibacillus ishigakijimensis]
MIFPLFAFLMGVSLVFSLSKSLAALGPRQTTVKILKRSALLYLFGLLTYGGISNGFEEIRLLGVLQRLALCFLGAGLAFVWLPRKGWLVLTTSLLLGYWLLLSFVPVPGGSAGDFAETKNWSDWIDKHFLPLRKWNGDHDPEGLLSTLPAICTTLLGMFAGKLLRDGEQDSLRKVKILALWGGAGIVGGLLWSLHFPLIKNIWTSSFVLLTAGISTLLLALFYYVIDIRSHRRWCQPFVWIGMNAITIYLLVHLVDFEHLARYFVGGEIRGGLESLWTGLGDLLAALLGLAFSVWLCRFLYRRGIFLRV